MLSGIVAIVGRPNVGKSSLLNALVGRKVSIVAPKPQTTRHRIQGVLHRPEGQVVFVDTPGLHRKAPRALNRYMNEAVTGALHDVDLALFVVEAGRWTDEDEAVLEKLKQGKAPVGLIVNKIDKLDNKAGLLPEIEKLAALHTYAFIVPLSAKSGDNLPGLVAELFSRMPEGPPLYPEGQIVGHDLGFTVSELVREKLMRALAQELPYALTVETETLDHSGTAAARLGGDLGRARQPEEDRHRRGRLHAQARGQRGAARTRIHDRRQGGAQAVGQGQGKLDRRSAGAEALRLPVEKRLAACD